MLFRTGRSISLHKVRLWGYENPNTAAWPDPDAKMEEVVGRVRAARGDGGYWDNLIELRSTSAILQIT